MEAGWKSVLWVGGGDGFEAILAALVAASHGVDMRIEVVEREAGAVACADIAVRRAYAATNGNDFEQAAALNTK